MTKSKVGTTASRSTRVRFLRQSGVLIGGVVIFLVVQLMPLPSGMSESARDLLAVVLLMATWWLGEGTSLSVTALLPLVLFPILGIMPSSAVAPNYASHLVFLFMGGFMIAIAMEKWNLHRRIALSIIVRVGTDIPRIVLGFMIACAFLSMWISNTATTMMMLPVAIAVVKQIAGDAHLDGEDPEAQRREIEVNLGVVLMLGLAYSASIGGVGTLIGTPANIVFSGFYTNLYPHLPEVTFMDWMLVATPVVVLFVPLVWLYLCRFAASTPLDQIPFGLDSANLVREELHRLGPMTRQEKLVAAIFFLTALLWMFRAPIEVGVVVVPGWSLLFPHPEFLHDATVAMTMAILLMLIPANGSTGVDLNERREFFLLDWERVQQKLPWGILLLYGGGFALADGFTKTGLDQWLGAYLAVVGALPVVAATLIICLAITFLTEMTSNTATITMALPIIGAAAVATGSHPLMFMVPATMAASFAFMMPVATPPNAIVFSSGWVSIAQMSRAGFALNVIGVLLVTLTALTLVGRVLT